MKHLSLILVLITALCFEVSSLIGAEAETNKTSQTQTVTVVPAPTPVAPVVQAAPAPVTPQHSDTPTVQNNIQVLPAQQPAQSIAYNKESAPADAAAVLGAHENRARSSRISLVPMVGGTGYFTRWNHHIGNQVTVGLLLDMSLTDRLSLEADGSYGRFNISYGGYGPVPYAHDFNQYTFGGNFKLYLSKGIIQPYVLGGLMGVYYQNMTNGPTNPYSYNHMLGATQAGAGVDIALTDDISIGPRFTCLVPTFNRPFTADNGYSSLPGFEDAGAMNTILYRALVALRVSL